MVSQMRVFVTIVVGREARNQRAWQSLLFLLAVLLLCASVLGEVYDPRRVADVVCCEQVERHWPVLNSWGRSCARHGTVAEQRERFLQLLRRHGVVVDDLAGPLCDARGLSRHAVVAFLRAQLCLELPENHKALAASPYSVFIEENPLFEDELTDQIRAACNALQADFVAGSQRWVDALHTATSVDKASLQLCGKPCTWVVDPIDGGRYDL